MASFSVHVTYGQSKKRLTCTTASLQQEIKSLFQLESENYFLQIWDAEFLDWVDVDDVATLEGQQSCRLQVVMR